MQVRRAFTIIELLISLSLASGIALSLVTIYKSSFSYLDKSREMIAINSSVCLLFNQLERDISAAFIPWAIHEIDPINNPADQVAQQNQQTLSPEEKKKAQQDEDAKKKNSYFFASIYDGNTYKLDGKKVSLLKEFSCITTGPMQFSYEERRPRIVRVSYVLEIDKERKHPTETFYTLFRKESVDIDDVKMLDDDTNVSKKGSSIRTFLVADGLKGLYVEWYVPDTKVTDLKKESPDIGSFVWGDADPRRGVVPQYGVIKVEFWNAKATGGIVFQTTIPVLYYSTTSDQNVLPGMSVGSNASSMSPATSAPQTGSSSQSGQSSGPTLMLASDPTIAGS